MGIESTEDGIIRRLREELEKELDRPRAEELMLNGVFVNDAVNQWWTGIASFDNVADQQARIREFLSFVRYGAAEMPVFVGHSLFFKEFYRLRISQQLDKNRPLLAEHMRRFRLSNATLMAVTVRFFGAEEDGLDDGLGQGLAGQGIRSGDALVVEGEGYLEGDAEIIDADVLLGGGFHGHLDLSHSHGHGHGRGQKKLDDEESSSTQQIGASILAFSRDLQKRVVREKEKLMQKLDL